MSLSRLSSMHVFYKNQITHLPTCLACLRAHVPMCLACLRAHLPTCLACLRVQVPYVPYVLRCLSCLTCLRANVPYVPCMLTYQHAFHVNWQRTLPLHVQKVLTGLFFGSEIVLLPCLVLPSSFDLFLTNLLNCCPAC